MRGIINVQEWERSLNLPFQRLRFSVFDSSGNILYDNYGLEVHSNLDVLSLPSVKMAIESDDNLGFNVSDLDGELGGDYYYYATLREGDIFARTGALGYEVELSDVLSIDKSLIWYALLIYGLAMMITYWSIKSIGNTIKRLSRFAQR